MAPGWQACVKGFDCIAQDFIKAKYLHNRAETKNYVTLRIMKNYFLAGGITLKRNKV